MIIVDKYIRFWGKYSIDKNTFWVSAGHEDRFYKMAYGNPIMGLKYPSGDQECTISNTIPYNDIKEIRKQKLEKINESKDT